MKLFRNDLIKIFNKLKNKENFAFSKYADGELSILDGKHIDLTKKANGEFKYDPSGSDEIYRKLLLNSFKYKHPDYYVGIGCPCCIGSHDFNRMKIMSEQNEDNLTWANIFVNSNYPFYVNNFIKEYSNHDVVLVVNNKADINRLPFKIKKDFRIGTDAWKQNLYLVDEIKDYIEDNRISNHLFLFCAGPFGNILAHQLHNFNKNNTYLDIGSTLDPFLNLGGTRGYHIGAPTINKVCTWQ